MRLGSLSRSFRLNPNPVPMTSVKHGLVKPAQVTEGPHKLDLRSQEILEYIRERDNKWRRRHLWTAPLATVGTLVGLTYLFEY